MARLAHQVAVESASVDAEVVSVDAFVELARRYRVTSVPHLLIDESRSLVGSVAPAALVAALLDGLPREKFDP